MITMDLIHYGSDRYDPALFQPVKDDFELHWLKPKGGLWTSPVGCEHGWKEWCEAEDFHTQKLKRSFIVRFTGRLFVIATQMDLYSIPESITPWGAWIPLWERLMAKGFDAVHLTWEGQCATRHTHPKSLYGWDCETVLVMNPKTITPLVPAEKGQFADQTEP